MRYVPFTHRPFKYQNHTLNEEIMLVNTRRIYEAVTTRFRSGWFGIRCSHRACSGNHYPASLSTPDNSLPSSATSTAFAAQDQKHTDIDKDQRSGCRHTHRAGL